MSREETREQLRDAIIICRQTTRAANEPDLSAEQRLSAYEADDRALGNVWRLIDELG